MAGPEYGLLGRGIAEGCLKIRASPSGSEGAPLVLAALDERVTGSGGGCAGESADWFA